MKNSEEMRQQLRSINRKSYPAYKGLKGLYHFGNYILSIDHVQGDPFASPSHVSIQISHRDAGFPVEYYKDTLTGTTLCDYLTRQFEKQVSQYSFRAKGSGKSGLLTVSHCGQEILSRTACEITEKGITARFFVGFPANGRTINATELEKILFDFLPVCIQKSFFYSSLNAKELQNYIELAEDQEFIRQTLPAKNLCAFIADGSILPRESGISSRPMKASVPFTSPDSLRISINLPHKGKITGMGIPKGITLIVGGGYHGKSTLLNALELGVYNHIPGDGREYVITDATAVKLRSEDGRFIKDVDISMFINDLPNKKDTRCFSTLDASGSTSQAAGIVESMEAGSHLFLLDEDTSATNFMVRDAFMQQVIQREKEPITPFLERAEDLYKKQGFLQFLLPVVPGHSFILQIQLSRWTITFQKILQLLSKKLCSQYPLPAVSVTDFQLPHSHRIMSRPAESSKRLIHNSRGNHSDSGAAKPERLKTRISGTDGFSLGRQEIDLRYTEQLIDAEQTAALGLLLKYAVEHLADGRRTLPEIVQFLWKNLSLHGLSFFTENQKISCGYATPRIQEIYACLNRYRGL